MVLEQRSTDGDVVRTVRCGVVYRGAGGTANS